MPSYGPRELITRLLWRWRYSRRATTIASTERFEFVVRTMGWPTRVITFSRVDFPRSERDMLFACCGRRVDFPGKMKVKRDFYSGRDVTAEHDRRSLFSQRTFQFTASMDSYIPNDDIKFYNGFVGYTLWYVWVQNTYLWHKNLSTQIFSKVCKR